MKTKIEIFAKEKFGIDLTLYQMNLLRAWSTGSQVVLIRGRLMGTNTAKKVYYAYLQDSVKDLTKETAAKIAGEF